MRLTSHAGLSPHLQVQHGSPTLATREVETEARTELQKLRLDFKSHRQTVQSQSERLRADLTTQSAELRVELDRLQIGAAAQSAKLLADLEQMKEELAELASSCRAQVAEVRAEVSSSWKNNHLHFGDALADFERKQEAELRRVKVLFQSLHKQVQEKTTSSPQKAVPEQQLRGARAEERFGQLQDIMHELEEERLSRNERLGELNERIAREVGDLRSYFVGQTEALTQNFEAETQDRKQEFSEIRAILDSVWNRVNVARSGGQETRKTNYLQYGGADGEKEEYKEVVGDYEDINALYQMVQETLGDNVYLKQQMSEVHAARSRDKQQLEEMGTELYNLRALLRTATPSAHHREINE